MPSDQEQPHRLTAAERQHELAMAAITRPPAPPEHSLALVRNAKGNVQIDRTTRSTDLAALEAEATATFDRLCAKYPLVTDGGAS